MMSATSSVAAVPDWVAPPPIGTTEHALWLAHWHFEFENPEQLHMLEQLYHDDIVWEVPSRRVIHRGKRDVLENYAKIFESCAEPNIVPVERYGTPERVFDDLEMTFKLIDSKGFPNHPLPVGTRIALRVVHNFHIQDGLIIRENGYEIWRPDISWPTATWWNSGSDQRLQARTSGTWRSSVPGLGCHQLGNHHR